MPKACNQKYKTIIYTISIKIILMKINEIIKVTQANVKYFVEIFYNIKYSATTIIFNIGLYWILYMPQWQELRCNTLLTYWSYNNNNKY